MPAIVYTDRQLLKQAGVGEVIAMGVVDPIGVVGFQHTDIFSYVKAAVDAMASTTTAETSTFLYVPRVAILRAVRLTVVGGSLVADPTNNAVITINKRDSAGINPLAVATLTTNAAGLGIATLPQYGTCSFTLTAANVRLAAGSTLTFAIAKGGTGVVVPISAVTVELEWD